MTDIKKLITVIIRINALAIILQAMALWSVIAVGIVSASLQSAPSKLSNYDSSLTLSVVYLIIGLILYARSKPLAVYFISDLQDKNEPPPIADR